MNSLPITSTIKPTRAIPFHRPSRMSSLQVACEFYWRVRAAGVHLVADYKVPSPRDRRLCRFKFAILNSDGWVCGFVATKGTPGSVIPSRKRRTTDKYADWGLPIVWVRGWKEIKPAAEQAIALAGLSKPDPNLNPVEWLSQFEEIPPKR